MATSTKNLGALRVLLPFLRPHLGRALGAAAALLMAAGLVLLIGQGLRRLIDEGFASQDASSLNSAALFMFVVVAALGFATSLRFYLVSWLGERVAADLRAAVFGHVLRLSPGSVETARTGDILSRMTADIALLQALIGSAISMGLRTALTSTGALVLLILSSPKLAGIIVVVVPIVVVPLILFGRRERRLSRAAQERVADLSAHA